MSEDWLWMSAADLGRGIAAGAIDPRELTGTYLAEIENHPDADSIYARTTAERAWAEAEAASERARRGGRRGPLDGVPISWKDLFDSAGTATEAGSALLEGRLPARDAAVLAAATRAGLVCLGKTHMSELAFSGLGVNPVTATAPNVNDAARAPGGSSSGAAASVALGLAAAGIGSDTGGSVRVPSAWNDLVGLKTTSGVLPLDGVVPLALRFDTVGPLARSVEDAGLLLAAMGGGAPPDPGGVRVGGLRLLVLEAAALQPVDAEPAAEAALELSGCVFSGEAYGLWRETIEARPEVMFFQIRDRFRSGGAYSAADYVAAWRRLEGLRREYRAATAAWDAVLLPTTPNLPPPVERLLDEPEYFRAQNLLTLRNTRVANLMGLPALSLPTGVPSCGLMAMGAPFGEARLLRLGAAIEAVVGG